MLRWFKELFGPKKIVIADPTLGIFDLGNGEFSGYIDADQQAFGSHFFSTEASDATPPTCDVLLIYARLLDSGQIEGHGASLRKIIRDSQAAIAIVAVGNSGGAYIAGALNPGYGHANLVMILERKGSRFGVFFDKLFAAMKRGQTMPVAWEKLVPQVPGLEHEGGPEAIFVCERGQLTFSSR